MKSRDPLGRSLLLALEQLVPSLRSVLPGDLSPTTVAVLARLDRFGDVRLSELAQAVGVTQPAMTQLVNRLEAERLVVRTRSSDDRRGVLVGLAEHGRDVLLSRRAHRTEVLDEVLARLDQGDRAAIADAMPALGRLIDHIQHHEKVRA